MAELQEVATALEALQVVYDAGAASDARRAATFYINQLEAGDPHNVVAVAVPLLQPGRPSEVRHFGCKLLQSIISNSWHLLAPEERNKMAEMVFNLLKQCARPEEGWALKSKAASLVADVVKREGPVLWKQMLPAILGMGASDATHAEVAAMVLQFIPEDVTIHNDDLDGERRRQLLMGLTTTLQDILPFLFKLIEQNYVAAMSKSAVNADGARLHGQVVRAALSAAVSYADWAPMNAILGSSLLDGCGVLLGSRDFRLKACEFMKRIACRRQASDDAMGAFDAVMEKVVSALINTTAVTLGGLLAGLSQMNRGDGAVAVDEMEFLERLCEAMVALGSSNIGAVTKDDGALRMFMQQMLTFSQVPLKKVVALILPFWASVLRDCTARTAAMGTAQQSSNGTKSGLTAGGGITSSKKAASKDKHPVVIIPSETCSALLEICQKNLLLKGEASSSDEDDDNVSIDHLAFRSYLVHVVHHVAILEPLLSMRYGLQRIQEVLGSVDTSSSQSMSADGKKALGNQLDSIYVFLNEVIKAVANTVSSNPSVLVPELKSTVGLMVTGVLSMESTQLWLIEAQSHLIETMVPFLGHFAGSASAAMQKLVSMVSSLPHQAQQMRPADGENETSHDVFDVRRTICYSILRLAIGAADTLAEHTWWLADVIDQWGQSHQLSETDHVILAEALITMGAASGKEVLAKVLERLLLPGKDSWLQLATNEWLHDPQRFVAFLMSQVSADTGHISDKLHWIQFNVFLYEKAIRRCKWVEVGGSATDKASATTLVASSGQAIGCLNVMAPHIVWIVEGLSPLLRCLHCLWSPAVRQDMPALIERAKCMGRTEQRALLREVSARGIATKSERQTDQSSGTTKGQEEELRRWLKATRDSAYDFLGAAVSAESFYSDLVLGASVFKKMTEALLSDLSYMEPHHLRLLVHQIAQPLIKACPREKWESCLGIFLPPVLIHCQGRLLELWSRVATDGATRMGEGRSADAGPPVQEMVAELLAEVILRKLTKDVSVMLEMIASIGWQPSHSGSGDGTAVSPADTMLEGGNEGRLGQENSLLNFLLGFRQDVAVAVVRMCVEIIGYPHTESVHKALPLCSALVTLACNNPQLHDVVGNKMLLAAIKALMAESNATVHAEVISLIRQIYVGLAPVCQTPHQVFRNLPSVTEERVGALDDALTKTKSVKEQKQHVKGFLLGIGHEHLKALVGKQIGMIKNVSE